MDTLLSTANAALTAGPPELPDLETLTLRREEAKTDFVPLLDAKKSAYEKRNPNRPFYDKFQKKSRHGSRR